MPECDTGKTTERLFTLNANNEIAKVSQFNFNRPIQWLQCAPLHPIQSNRNASTHTTSFESLETFNLLAIIIQIVIMCQLYHRQQHRIPPPFQLSSNQQSHRQYVKFNLYFFQFATIQNGFATVCYAFFIRTNKTFDTIRSTAFSFAWQTPDLTLSSTTENIFYIFLQKTLKVTKAYGILLKW